MQCLAEILPPPWRYFARRKEGEKEILRWGWCWREADAAFLARDLSQFDTYVQLNESRGNEPRPTKEGITGWRGFFIDIDPVDAAPSVWYARSAAVHAVHEMLSIQPSITTVMTGRGIQLWILFPEVIRPVPYWVEPALRAFLSYLDARVGNGRHGCRMDVSVADMTRLARMPFTVNQRTKALGYVERVGDVRLNSAVPDALKERWYTPPQRPTPPPRAGGHLTWGAVLHRLPLLAADYLTDGVAKGDRHRALCSVAYSLREQGCSENQVWKAFVVGNDLCTDPLDQGELRRAMKSTRKRA